MLDLGRDTLPSSSSSCPSSSSSISFSPTSILLGLPSSPLSLNKMVFHISKGKLLLKPAVKTLVQLWRTAFDQVVLQLVLPRKALVTVVTWTSVGSFPRVQQLVPGHMLWPSELLATYITGVFVVYLGAERQFICARSRSIILPYLCVFTCCVSLLSLKNSFPHWLQENTLLFPLLGLASSEWLLLLCRASHPSVVKD